MSRARAGTGVPPSPLNPVKLELAVIVVAGAVLWLMQGRLSTDPLVQLLLLAAYGLSATAWLVLRIRAVARRARGRAGAVPARAHEPE